MKIVLRSVSAGIIVCVLNGTLLVQAQPDSESKTDAQVSQTPSNTQEAGFDYEQARKYLDMTGRKARDANNRSIGRIHHIVAASPENAVAQIEAKGRYAVVPYASLSKEQNRLGQTRVTINSTAKQIASGPTIAYEEWANVDVSNPQFMQRLYAHHNLPRDTDTAVGAGTVGSGGTVTGAGSSGATDQKQQ